MPISSNNGCAEICAQPLGLCWFNFAAIFLADASSVLRLPSEDDPLIFVRITLEIIQADFYSRLLHEQFCTIRKTSTVVPLDFSEGQSQALLVFAV